MQLFWWMMSLVVVVMQLHQPSGGVALAAAVASPSISRPSVVHFGFYYNMQDAPYQYDGVQLFAGLKAAEKEMNDGNVLIGTNVSFDFIAAPSEASSSLIRLQSAQNATRAFGGLFGFVLSEYGSTDVLYQAALTAENGTIPVVAPITASDYEFSDSNYSFVAHLRQPPRTQAVLMLHHALNNDMTHCTHFAVIVRPQFMFMVRDIEGVLEERFGYEDPLVMALDTNASVLNVSTLLDTWAGTSTVDIPPCGLFFTPPSDIQRILDAMFVDPRFASSFAFMTFYSSIFGRQTVWNHTTFGTAPYRRLFFPSGFPDATSTTIPIASQYRTAMETYLLSITPNVSSGTAVLFVPNQQQPEMQIYPINPRPNQRSFEGYFAGRYVGAVLKSLPLLTPSSFLHEMYDRHYYVVGDVTLGPLTSQCVYDPTVVYPCFCNVALDTTYIAQVNATTGVATPMRGDWVSVQSEITAPLEGECFTTMDTLVSPVHVALFSPANMSPTATASFTRFATVLRTTAGYYNRIGRYPGKYFSVAWMNYAAGLSPNANGAANQNLLNAVYHQRQPMVTLGSWFPSVTLPVFNMYLSTATFYEDVPLAPPTQYSRYTWSLKLVLADLVHGLAVFLQSRANDQRQQPKVWILADTATSYRLALSSLNTVQVDPFHSVIANVTAADGGAASIADVLNAAVTSANEGQNVVVFASLINTASAFAVMAAAVAMATANASSRYVPLNTGSESRFVFAIATDLTNMMNAKFLTPNIASLTRFPIFFGSAYAPYWEPGNPQRASMASFLNTNDTVLLEAPAIYTAALAIQVTMAGMPSSSSSSSSNVSATSIVDALYATEQLVLDGVTIGPIYGGNCSDQEIIENRRNRKCQCFKALRTVRIFDYRDWIHNSNRYNPQFSWSMSTCGVSYEPLRVDSRVNVALIAGIAAPLGVAALSSMFLFMCLCSGRSNRRAPKDPDTPFAMVFTDIQSSTSLWARAPEVMGDALEQHHELVRKLVADHDGYEVKTIGDSFMVAFKRASDAASFALAIQTTLFDATWAIDVDACYIELAQEAEEDRRMQEGQEQGQGGEASSTPLGGTSPAGKALSTSSSNNNSGTMLYHHSHHPHHGNTTVVPQWDDEKNYPLNWNGIRVRVGLHWGVGSVKFDPVSRGYDYYGTLVNTAARVEGVGNGGQVLATRDLYTQLEAEVFSFSDTEVTPLGPQPLRGLDAPVPLYQLCPMRLRSRQFNPLRLDVEVDLDESTTCASETTHLSDGRISQTETPEEYLERLLQRQQRGDGAAALRPLVVRALEFLDCAFRVTSTAWRKETLSTLMKRWHVGHHKAMHQRPDIRVTKEAADRQVALDMVGLCVRIVLASEEAKRQEQQHLLNSDVRRLVDGTSVHSGCSDRYRSAVVARRSSIRSLQTLKY